jgi:serine/threonine protein kinase
MEPIGDFEYSKKDLIGHGAFAVVFKGRYRKKPEFTVAIKCITKKNLAKSQNLLSKEIKILRELSDLHHENVVALLDCKETSHHVYLVMEYCNGGDLADYLQAKGTLSEDTIAAFLRQIAEAMKALNAKGIVHRDMKPQNILLCHTSRHTSTGDIKLKIADFGFARFLQDGVMAATLCGSPMYMAPEVIMSLQYDAKADLWSVGTIVYQCLTGKAPFQAQTPQQLKQFYERNANLQPNIPNGTSPHLKLLLMGMLKRNAKDRIDFDEFFNHPFLHPARLSPKSSSPVPVPAARTRNRSSGSSDSPPIKAVSSSPLSGVMPMSPPHPVIQRVRDQSTHEPMEVTRDDPQAATLVPGTSPADDFVMVPDNIPSDHSADSNSSRRYPSSVDLNAIFSDNSAPETSPKAPRSVAVSPQGGAFRKGGSPQQMSPSRPSTLLVQSPVQSPPSQPIPVPTQVKAYEQMQRSQSPNNRTPSSRDSTPTPQSEFQPQVASMTSQDSVTDSVPIPSLSRKGSVSSIPDIGSMSPPTVQFTIGTPPPSGTLMHRQSYGTPPSNSNSPLRRPGPSSLPTILGSPTKMNVAAGGFHLHPPQQVSMESEESPTGVPLQTPFATTRTKTCPGDFAAVGFSPSPDGQNAIVPMRSSSSEQVHMFKNSSSSSKLSEQLLRAAFGQTSPSGAAGLPTQSPTGQVVPYAGGSSTSLGKASSTSSLKDRSGSFDRDRSKRDSGGYMADVESPSSGRMPYCTSSPNMEGPISFVAPELVEETLMDKEHNETVAKLNFVLALTECIIELAHSRSSPITESVDQKQGNTFRLDHLSFVSESQRHMEQLVLYVRALQLLTSAIDLAREETKANRLQPSNSVKLILREMNNYYHQCLNLCKHLHSKGVSNNPDVNPQNAAVTADKLVYSYAIEMCQTAALDELFGNPQECFRRYRSAQILLHSLAQQAHNPRDRDLLNKYKENVEKRLFMLTSQGLVQAYDSS